MSVSSTSVSHQTGQGGHLVLQAGRFTATVTRVVRETPTVTTLYFTVQADSGGTEWRYTAGQYITVYFDETGMQSGKAYSLSSAPSEPESAITVKDVGGVFSSHLCALQVGDVFSISSPFGFLNVGTDAPIVAIAGGVGVAPLRSILYDTLATDPTRAMYTFLSAPTKAELVFFNSLQHHFCSYTNTTLKGFITQEVQEGFHNRRFDCTRDCSAYVLANAQFYVCGSEDFVCGIWQQLMKAGVDERRVATETFFEHAL